MSWTIGFRFPAEARIFSSSQHIQTRPEAHPVSYPVCNGVSSPKVIRPDRKADHSPPSSVEVKNVSEFGLGPLIQNLTSETYDSIFEHLVGHLGRGMCPSQGFYLHRTTQKNTDIHPCLERNSKPRSQCSSGRNSTCLRPCGHWDWQVKNEWSLISTTTYFYIS